MDSLLIQKWVADVHDLFISENELDFDFMMRVEKDQTWIIELLSSYDVNDKVFKLYQFEMFVVQYKSLAKQFTEKIKPTLPFAWMGTSMQERPPKEGRVVANMFFGELEHAFWIWQRRKSYLTRLLPSSQMCGQLTRRTGCHMGLLRTHGWR